MPDLAREPSMEDILASIKRIIADDGAAASAANAARPRRGPVEVPPPAPRDEDVLELTDAVAPVALPGFRSEAEPVAPPEPEREEAAGEVPPPPAAVSPSAAQPAPPPASAPLSPAILSEQAASASRLSLAALSALVVTPGPGAGATTLEELVRDLLRPMLKDWLDAQLPELVEGMVAREIARITGRSL